jgi:hypothetical protein
MSQPAGAEAGVGCSAEVAHRAIGAEGLRDALAGEQVSGLDWNCYATVNKWLDLGSGQHGSVHFNVNRPILAGLFEGGGGCE